MPFIFYNYVISRTQERMFLSHGDGYPFTNHSFSAHCNHNCHFMVDGNANAFVMKIRRVSYLRINGFVIHRTWKVGENDTCKDSADFFTDGLR